MRIEPPPGLKPLAYSALNGAAKAAPLQHSSPVRLAFRWSWWTLLPLAFACLALAVPYMLTHALLPLGLALQRGFALVCHQRPERCFWIFGAPVAVCARCLGIYFGAALGLLMRSTRRTALAGLAFATALNLVEAATEFVGMYTGSLLLRFGLGLLLGMAAALLIRASWEERMTSELQP